MIIKIWTSCCPGWREIKNLKAVKNKLICGTCGFEVMEYSEENGVRIRRTNMEKRFRHLNKFGKITKFSKGSSANISCRKDCAPYRDIFFRVENTSWDGVKYKIRNFSL